MNLPTIEKLLKRSLEDLEGQDGFWHGHRQGVTIYVVVDEQHDRMRIMAPIGEIRASDFGFLKILLQANFDRALDAKYAMRKKEVWSVFMHPLSSLVPDDMTIFLDQVARLVQNTGTSYASSDLVFGADEETEEELEGQYEAEDDTDIDDEDESGPEPGNGEDPDVDPDTSAAIDRLIGPIRPTGE